MQRYLSSILLAIMLSICLSYLIDPIETRYMRNDEVLGTTQTSSYDSMLFNYNLAVVTMYFGIRVYEVYANASTHEITSGTPVAIASGSSSGLKSATWACPGHALISTDKIRIVVYVSQYDPPENPPTLALQTFNTEVLGATQLDVATWTVYYYLFRTTPNYSYYFRYGTSTYNSRIMNFTWTSGGPSKSWHGVSSWTFSLFARQWLTGTSWIFNLPTRQWLIGTSWIFDFLTRQWVQTAPWIFTVTGKTFFDVANWHLTLRAPEWINVGSWIFTLTGPQWHFIRFWNLGLGPGGISIASLFIPILFLVMIVAIIMGLKVSKKI